MNTADKSRDFVNSLARGLSVLRAFDAEHDEMTLSEVAAITGMTRAGARRFLLTLNELGYVAKHNRWFRLTPKVLELGYSYLAAMPITELSQPYLNRVTEQTGESCSLAVLDGREVVYLARSAARRLLMYGIHVGTRLPWYYTSMGRMLVAGMDPTALEQFINEEKLLKRTKFSVTDKPALLREATLARKQGYAVLDQELEEGLRSLAVPIIGSDGRVVAAVNISTNVATVSKEKLLKEFLPILKVAAKNIQASLRT